MFIGTKKRPYAKFGLNRKCSGLAQSSKFELFEFENCSRVVAIWKSKFIFLMTNLLKCMKRSCVT